MSPEWAEKLSGLPRAQTLAGSERKRVAALLRTAYEVGASIRDLQNATGYPYNTTRDLLLFAGTELRRPGRQPGESRGPNQWTPEQVQELKELVAKGWSASRIGRKLGRSREAVQFKIRGLRLPRRRYVSIGDY